MAGNEHYETLSLETRAFSSNNTLRSVDFHSDKKEEEPNLTETEKSCPESNSSKAFPDGGVQAWLTVIGSAACLFCSFGWVNAVGIFQDYYEETLLREYSASTIAWIPSLQVFFLLAGGPFVGKILDDFGPRLPLMFGTLLHILGLMMLSISTKYYQVLLSQAVCSALGASMIFYPGFACTSTWFDKKRSLALGLVTAGSSLGGIILPIMVIRLNPVLGFGWTIRICAFLMLGLLIFANLTVRYRITPTRRPFSLLAFVLPLREVVFLCLSSAVFLFVWAMFTPVTFMVAQARSVGVTPDLVPYLVPIYNAASIIGRTVPNALADRVGHFNMMVLMSALTTIIVLALWLPAANAGALIAFAVLIGISTGAGISLTPVLVAKISKLEDIGVRVGIVYALGSVAALTGSPLGGALIETNLGSYRATIIFAGLASAVATALYVLTRTLASGGGFKF